MRKNDIDDAAYSAENPLFDTGVIENWDTASLPPVEEEEFESVFLTEEIAAQEIETELAAQEAHAQEELFSEEPDFETVLLTEPLPAEEIDAEAAAAERLEAEALAAEVFTSPSMREEAAERPAAMEAKKETASAKAEKEAAAAHAEAEPELDFLHFEEEEEAEGLSDDFSEKRGAGLLARLALWREEILDLRADPRKARVMDAAIILMGVFIVCTGFLLGTHLVSAGQRPAQSNEKTFAQIGEEFPGVAMIGTGTIQAVAEERKAQDEQRAEQLRLEKEAEEKRRQEEEEARVGSREVVMSVSSVLSDLKIKFLLKEQQTMLAGVPFRVEVKDPSGKVSVYTDDDKDGIVYKDKLAAGDYTVKLLAFEEKDLKADKKLREYKLPAESQTVKVTDKLAYQKIDIAGEVKKESEINVAQEDTAKKDTVVESVAVDTVQWVESTRTEVGDGEGAFSEDTTTYEKVDKNDIPNPFNTASAGLYSHYHVLAMHRRLPLHFAEEGLDSESFSAEGEEPTDSGETPGSNEEPETPPPDAPLTEITISIPYSETMLMEGNDPVNLPQATITGLDNTEVDWSVIEGKDVLALEGGTVRPLKPGVSVLKVTSRAKSELYTTLRITVNAKQQPVAIQSVPDTLTVQVGKTAKINPSVTGSSDTAVIYACDNESVATVSGDGTVKGVKEGKANITVTASADSNVKKTVKVTVQNGVDTTARLKDKDGNPLYIRKADGSYAEAVVGDYEKYDTFYRRVSSTKKYRYTGWQTIEGKTYFFNADGTYVTGEQTIQGAKYTFSSEGVLLTGKTTMGIDVSTWNGNIDWNAVRNSGVTFAIIRCGYRGSSIGKIIEDSKFRANIQGASNAGIKVGIYFFSQAVNEVEAVEEASFCIDMARNYHLSLPVFLDVESSGGRGDGVSVSQRTANIQAFCRTVANSGYAPGVYANTTWFNERINTGSLTSYHIWLAQYAAAPTYSRTRYDLWQYTSTGRVSGISGNVDMNISYRSY